LHYINAKGYSRLVLKDIGLEIEWEKVERWGGWGDGVAILLYKQGLAAYEAHALLP
jgi:hypothetical protein